MNVEELDKALRLINGNLITEKECQYIRFVNENNRIEMNFFICWFRLDFENTRS